MTKLSPTQRTLAYFRGLGFDVGVTEKWNHYAGIRQDLFGFIDLIAMDDVETIAIQATSGSNTSARTKKILRIPEAHRWVKGPNRRLVVIGWRKLKNRGPNGKWWQAKWVEITEEDFDG